MPGPGRLPGPFWEAGARFCSATESAALGFGGLAALRETQRLKAHSLQRLRYA